MRFTKGHLRFSRKEIWNLGEHLALCIHDGLLQFKNSERMGHPGDISEEIWEEYLDKMLYSFKEISIYYKHDPYEVYFKENWKKEYNDFEVDENGRMINKIEIPDTVLEESKKYYEKIKEGLKLFSEYYMDLWD
jgi:hypothetical protein